MSCIFKANVGDSAVILDGDPPESMIVFQAIYAKYELAYPDFGVGHLCTGGGLVQILVRGP